MLRRYTGRTHKNISLDQNLRKIKASFSIQTHSYDLLNSILTVGRIHLILSATPALQNKLHLGKRAGSVFWSFTFMLVRSVIVGPQLATLSPKNSCLNWQHLRTLRMVKNWTFTYFTLFWLWFIFIKYNQKQNKPLQLIQKNTNAKKVE